MWNKCRGIAIALVLCLAASAVMTVAAACADQTSAEPPGATSRSSETAATTAAPETTTPVPAPPVVWTKLEPAGDTPPARAGHAMVYAQSSGKVILFGGWDGTDFNDTWAYDPAVKTWTDLDPAGDVPPPRHDHAMAYDAATDKVILFGGMDATTYMEFGDTWAYDPAANKWTELDPPGDAPKSRCLHSMVYDPTAGQVLVYGGTSHGGCLGDVWAYDWATKTWTELDPTGEGVETVHDPANDEPLSRYGSRLVYDPELGKSVLFGGSDGHLIGDTWAYETAVNTWANLVWVDSPAPRPAARQFYGMAYDSENQKTVLFGGCGITPLDDTWAFDSATNTWTALQPERDTPSARTFTAMVYVTETAEFILFGGSEEVAPTKPVGDTWSGSLTP